MHRMASVASARSQMKIVTVELRKVRSIIYNIHLPQALNTHRNFHVLLWAKKRMMMWPGQCHQNINRKSSCSWWNFYINIWVLQILHYCDESHVCDVCRHIPGLHNYNHDHIRGISWREIVEPSDLEPYTNKVLRVGDSVISNLNERKVLLEVDSGDLRKDRDILPGSFVMCIRYAWTASKNTRQD